MRDKHYQAITVNTFAIRRELHKASNNLFITLFFLSASHTFPRKNFKNFLEKTGETCSTINLADYAAENFGKFQAESENRWI